MCIRDRRDSDRFIDARADIANAELQRRIAVVRAAVPPDFTAIGDAAGARQRADHVVPVSFGAADFRCA